MLEGCGGMGGHAPSQTSLGPWAPSRLEFSNITGMATAATAN